MVDVSRCVTCMWRVVCGESGSFLESCCGWREGDIGLGGDADGADC